MVTRDCLDLRKFFPLYKLQWHFLILPIILRVASLLITASHCVGPSSPGHGLKIGTVLLITPGCGLRACKIIHLPSGAWCLTFTTWRDLHQRDIFQCNCLLIGTKHRRGNKQAFAPRQVSASMGWRSSCRVPARCCCWGCSLLPGTVPLAPGWMCSQSFLLKIKLTESRGSSHAIC